MSILTPRRIIIGSAVIAAGVLGVSGVAFAKAVDENLVPVVTSVPLTVATGSPATAPSPNATHDPATHDANDDHGLNDPATHDVNDDHGDDHNGAAVPSNSSTTTPGTTGSGAATSGSGHGHDDGNGNDDSGHGSDDSGHGDD